MDLTNERGACPSASKMSQIFHCPASFKLNLSEIPTSSAAAEEGTMLHRVCELEVRKERGENALEDEYSTLWEKLTEEQKDTCLYASSQSFEEINLYGFRDVEVLTETRLWAKSELFSGKGDLVVICKDAATIIDYKFGRGEVERAESNLQLAALAVLVADNFEGITAVKVMIVQPRALSKEKRITQAVFELDAINDAREQINAVCKEALTSESPKQSCGYWCKFCESSYRCKAANAEITRQINIATSSAGTAIGVHNARQEFEKCKAAEKFIAARLSKIREFLTNNPDAGDICGLTLKQGSKRAKLGNANDIYDAIQNVGISPEEFVEVCDVGMTKLQKLYYSKRKISNEKQTKTGADLELKNLLQDKGLLSYSQSAPTVEVKDL